MATREQDLEQQDREDREQPTGDGGLRSRKKRRTRRAIKDAAVELFGQRGYDSTTVEDIAARAEVSVSTFFRYFASKDEVIFSERSDRLPALRRAILDRPAAEGDLDVVRLAFREAVSVGDDPLELTRYVHLLATSPILRGRAAEIVDEWCAEIRRALADRRGLAEPDDECWIVANVAMGAIEHAWTKWSSDRSEPYETKVDDAFAELVRVSRTWS